MPHLWQSHVRVIGGMCMLSAHQRVDGLVISLYVERVADGLAQLNRLNVPVFVFIP